MVVLGQAGVTDGLCRLGVEGAGELRIPVEDAAGVGDGVPRCDACGGIVKPDVVLYEEGLDEQTMENAVNAIRRADTLIVGGTSLAVYPAAGLVHYFQGKHLVLINKSSTSADSSADLLIQNDIAKVMKEAVEVLQNL